MLCALEGAAEGFNHTLMLTSVVGAAAMVAGASQWVR